MSPPGHSTQRPANKGRGFRQSKPRAEKKRPGASRSSESVRRGQGEAQAHVLQGTCQPAHAWGRHPPGCGGRAAPDLGAFRRQPAGFWLTLRRQGAPLLEGSTPSPGTIHQPPLPGGSSQPHCTWPQPLSLMLAWLVLLRCPQRSGVGQGRAPRGRELSCPTTIPQPGPAPSPAPATASQDKGTLASKHQSLLGEGEGEQEGQLSRDPAD